MGKKLDEIKRTGGQIAESVAGKASDAGAGIADLAKKGAGQAQKGIEETAYKMRLKIYNPLFPNVYFAPGYSLPQMVAIEDGEARKDIDVCEGAIGWTSQEAKLTVVHLYRTFVEESGITFYPAAKMDAVYMVDASDPSRYIDLSKYFEIMDRERVAELMEIGRALGAKKVTVKSHEAAMKVSLAKAKGKAEAKEKNQKKKESGNKEEKNKETEQPATIGASLSSSLSKNSNWESRVCEVHEYPGTTDPKRPNLHWFKDDLGINNLIESVCSKESTNKPKKIQQSVITKSSESIAGVVGSRVDAALKKMDADFNFNVDGEVKRELRKVLELDIEF